ncbi:unnamed protein product, partial [Rotaria sp. Silwood1]
PQQQQQWQPNAYGNNILTKFVIN